MERRLQFSLRNLLAMMFLWSLAFILLLEFVPVVKPSHPMVTRTYIVLFPVALGPAVGGLFSRMRTGFVIGLVTGFVTLVVFICIERLAGP
jgi:hypothetical protein